MATAIFKPYRSYGTVEATFHYRTIQDTAVPGRDYVEKEGDITIPVGSTSVEIPVEVSDKNRTDSQEAFIWSFCQTSRVL